MPFSSSDIDNRLRFFGELFSTQSDFRLWSYDASGNLLASSREELALDSIFRHSNGFNAMLEHSKCSTSPLVMSNSVGLMWGAAFEMDEQSLYRIHVLGPILTQTVSTLEFERIVWGTEISPSWKPKFLQLMQQLPVLSATTFFHLVLMMQYCITGEQLQVSDIVMQRESGSTPKESSEESTHHADRIQVYMAERALLHMITCGDINYQDVLQKVVGTFTGNQKLSSNALQHAKLSQVQFVALCCHAALEGGLPVEMAYNRKDAYIQDIEHAANISEITEIGKTMYADFVTLVYRQRQNPKLSKAVQSCCDYIESHLSENVPTGVLASRVGYTDYYLSRLFKKETGFSLDEYARYAKMERAKLLLATTQNSINSIAESLGFSGRNYFATTFRKIVGIPPAEYRRKHQQF